MTTVSVKADSLKTQLSKIRNGLLEQKGARDQLASVLDKEKSDYEQYRENQKLHQKAHLFLLSEIIDRRKQAVESIEKIATLALKLVYGEGYGLQFNTFDEKRKDGANNFKMEINIASPYEGDELITGLMGSRGGGVVEMVAFALRIAALNWVGYKGPLILDEAYKSMSSDEKLTSVANFLKDVTKETGRQLIFATHKAEVFGKIADNIVLIEQNNGIAQIQYLTYARFLDMIEEQTW